MNESTNAGQVAVGESTIKPTRCKINPDAAKAVKAYVDIRVGNIITVKGWKVVKGNNGLFVSPPQTLSNSKWYDNCTCFNQDIQDEVEHIILKYYKSEAKAE